MKDPVFSNSNFVRPVENDLLPELSPWRMWEVSKKEILELSIVNSKLNEEYHDASESLL